MADDDDELEKYRIIKAMDEKTRKDWDLLLQKNFDLLHDKRHFDMANGLSEKEAGDRQADIRAKTDVEEAAFLQEAQRQQIRQKEEQEQATFREDETKSRSFTEESLHKEEAQREAETTSKFFDAKEQERLAHEARQAALTEQALEQDHAIKAQFAAEHLGVADAAREQEAIQKRNAEIIEKNNQIEKQLEDGTLQPPSIQKVEEAIQKQYDARRDELAKDINDLKQKEIEKTIGGIEDPEMRDYLEAQKREIEEKYAKIEAGRLEAIAREERARLERERSFGGREY